MPSMCLPLDRCDRRLSHLTRRRIRQPRTRAGWSTGVPFWLMPTITAAVARLENGEDEERGRLARRPAPRSSHGEWEPAPGRPDPVATLHRQAESRLPELVPIRY